MVHGVPSADFRLSQRQCNSLIKYMITPAYNVHDRYEPILDFKAKMNISVEFLLSIMESSTNAAFRPTTHCML